MERFFQDVRYGLRMLAKSPGFTAVAILTLALGIGANTAVFSLTDQVLLRNLPVSHPEQLVELVSPGPDPGSTWNDGITGSSFSYPMYKDLRVSLNSAFTGLLATFPTTVDVAGIGISGRVPAELVSGNYFEVLGVTPALGRVLSTYDETAPGANPVAVLSYGFWQQHFGRDPGVLNKTLDVNGTSLTIVGVARKGYQGIQIGASPGLFVPITMKGQLDPGREKLDHRKDHWAQVLARLKPGFSTRDAEAAIAPSYHALLESELPVYNEFFASNDRKKFVAKPLLLIRASQGRPIIQRSIEQPVLTLMIMVGLVLLIACANLAGLLAARGETRQREISVRLALGASRLRLVRQLLTEGLLLSLAGCICGLLFASWTLGLLVAALKNGMQVLGLRASLDDRVLFFAVGISACATILFALAPALHSTRMDLQSSLKEHGASAGGTASVRLRQLLIVSQVALTAVLLTASGLLVKSLMNLDRTNLGMNVSHVLQFSVSPALNQYTPQRTAELFDHLRSAIGQLPGVRSVAVAVVPLFANSDWDADFTAQGYIPAPGDRPFAQLNVVSPGYFSAMGIPLLSGREFSDADGNAGDPRVAMINEALARKYFAPQNPIGLHVWFGKGKGIQQPGFEIVGVVQGSKHDNVRDKILPFIYFPFPQNASGKLVLPLGSGTFYVRTQQEPTALISELRDTINRFDPHLPIYDVRTLSEQVEQSMFSNRMMTFLSVALGSLAALLAGVGLYGVMAYIIMRRTREIGIRMALGAQRQDVLRMVIFQGGRLAAIGLVAGVVLAAGVSRYIASQLFGVSADDPFIFVAAAALLMVIALAACWVPARRATRIDPMAALRHE